MTASQPNILVPREGETGLLWAIAASALAHVAAIVAVVVAPKYWPAPPTPSVSYTVDLIASAEPAGTNLTAGHARPKPAAPPPPAPVVNAPAPEVPPQEPPSPIEPKPQPPAPVPPQAAPAPVIPPKPIVAKPVVEPAQKADLKLASKTVKPTPPLVKQPEPTAVGAQATAVVAKPTKMPARPTAPVAQPTAVLAQKPTPMMAATAAAKAVSEAEAREKQIAAAVQRRTQDQQISDAIQRRADAVRGPSAGAEGASPGGPISVGQGSGSGGVVEGLDMVLYRGQMERRIKENWVWAGEDLKLEVKVQFDVTAKGEIQNVRITGSSGNPSYDASAERAVRAASPLAPPPEKYRDLFVHGVEITFRAQDLQS